MSNAQDTETWRTWTFSHGTLRRVHQFEFITNGPEHSVHRLMVYEYPDEFGADRFRAFVDSGGFRLAGGSMRAATLDEALHGSVNILNDAIARRQHQA